MANKNFDFQSLKVKLAERGLKVTSQRLVIFQCLLKYNEHPSAEMIFERIKDDHPSISLATVYKTLDTLVEAGLAKKIESWDALKRFDAKTEQHTHLFCINTNEIIDFEDAELSGLLEEYFKRKEFKNFTVTDFQLQINGQIGDKPNLSQ